MDDKYHFSCQFTADLASWVLGTGVGVGVREGVVWCVCGGGYPGTVQGH